MKSLLLTLSLALVILGCEAKEPVKTESAAPPASAQTQVPTASTSKTVTPGLREELLEKARARKGGEEPTQLDLFNELMRKGAEKAGAIPDYGKPRIVPQGAKPEIIIKGDKVTYNGKLLAFGRPINEWKKILTSKARCDSTKLATACVWDDIGVQAGSTIGSKHEAVSYLTIILNKRPLDSYKELEKDIPNGGATMNPSIDYSPKQAFSGYLELDGFGIDAKTEFWELLKTANPERNLRCGIRDCTHPGGALSSGSGALYLTTNRNDEHGNIYEFSISQ